MENPLKKSKFKEYLELYTNGAKNIDKVLEGRLNKSLRDLNELSPDKKAIAEERFKICSECPFNSNNARLGGEFDKWYKKGYENINGVEFPYPKAEYYSNRPKEDFHCAHCGCNIDEKTLSMESNCGIEIYNSTWKMNEPLKWKAWQ